LKLAGLDKMSNDNSARRESTHFFSSLRLAATSVAVFFVPMSTKEPLLTLIHYYIRVANKGYINKRR